MDGNGALEREHPSRAIKATINRRRDTQQQQQLVAVSSDHKRDRKGFGGDEALAVRSQKHKIILACVAV